MYWSHLHMMYWSHLHMMYWSHLHMMYWSHLHMMYWSHLHMMYWSPVDHVSVPGSRKLRNKFMCKSGSSQVIIDYGEHFKCLVGPLSCLVTAITLVAVCCCVASVPLSWIYYVIYVRISVTWSSHCWARPLPLALRGRRCGYQRLVCLTWTRGVVPKCCVAWCSFCSGNTSRQELIKVTHHWAVNQVWKLTRCGLTSASLGRLRS